VRECDLRGVVVRCDFRNCRRLPESRWHRVHDVAAREAEPEPALRLPDERIAASSERQCQDNLVLLEAPPVGAVEERRGPPGGGVRRARPPRAPPIRQGRHGAHPRGPRAPAPRPPPTRRRPFPPATAPLRPPSPVPYTARSEPASGRRRTDAR